MGVGDDVGEADDDVPLQLNWGTIAAENKDRVVKTVTPVVGYRK